MTTFSQFLNSIEKKDISKIKKISTNIKRGITISGNSLDSISKYYKNPNNRKKLIKEGKVWYNIPFFDKHIPELLKNVVEPLYSPGSDDVDDMKNSLNRLLHAERNKYDDLEMGLKRIRQQYSRLSRPSEGDKDMANEDIKNLIDEFQNSIPKKFENWKFFSSLDLNIENIHKLIKEVERLKGLMERGLKRGRNPKSFNVLIFHVVNQFTNFAYVRDNHKNLKRIEHPLEDGKYRVRKNWQLILVALLWIHVHHHKIPEMEIFIKKHEKEEVNSALKKMIIIIKKEYQNFCRSGKGIKKFRGPFLNGSEFLNMRIPYIDQAGHLHIKTL